MTETEKPKRTRKTKTVAATEAPVPVPVPTTATPPTHDDACAASGNFTPPDACDCSAADRNPAPAAQEPAGAPIASDEHLPVTPFVASVEPAAAAAVAAVHADCATSGDCECVAPAPIIDPDPDPAPASPPIEITPEALTEIGKMQTRLLMQEQAAELVRVHLFDDMQDLSRKLALALATGAVAAATAEANGKLAVEQGARLQEALQEIAGLKSAVVVDARFVDVDVYTEEEAIAVARHGLTPGFELREIDEILKMPLREYEKTTWRARVALDAARDLVAAALNERDQRLNAEEPSMSLVEQTALIKERNDLKAALLKEREHSTNLADIAQRAEHERDALAAERDALNVKLVPIVQGWIRAANVMRGRDMNRASLLDDLATDPEVAAALAVTP